VFVSFIASSTDVARDCNKRRYKSVKYCSSVSSLFLLQCRPLSRRRPRSARCCRNMIPPDQSSSEHLRPPTSSSRVELQQQDCSCSSSVPECTEQDVDCSCCCLQDDDVLTGRLRRLVPVRTGVAGQRRTSRRAAVIRRGTVSTHTSGAQRTRTSSDGAEPALPRQVFRYLAQRTC